MLSQDLIYVLSSEVRHQRIRSLIESKKGVEKVCKLKKDSNKPIPRVDDLIAENKIEKHAPKPEVKTPKLLKG